MKASSSICRTLSSLTLPPSKIRNKGRNGGMGKGSLIFTLLMVSAFRMAHSFSTTSFQIQTASTKKRKARPNGVGRRHGRSIQTTLASDITLDYYDPYKTANKIEPQTPTISESLMFYGKFLVDHFNKNSLKNKTKREKRNMIQRMLKRNEKPKAKENTMWKQMNEQRKNIMTLAGCTASFVVPSFGFLLLGAFMTSIEPLYWAKCIQCVATLDATKAQLVEALVGVSVSSILAGLFTGIRGSLFWIGGTCMML